jgi:virginiamycin A acetyltransferase
MAVQDNGPASLTAEILDGRVWTFGLQNGDLFARNVVLGQSGRFLHYASPNEHTWSVEDDTLLIFAKDGRVSCRMRRVESADPQRIWLEGEHVLGGPSGLVLSLRETGIIYPVHLPWCSAYETFAESVPFFYSSTRAIRGAIPYGRMISIHGPSFVEPYSCLPQGQMLTVGAFSYCHGSFLSETRASIGRYCSIAGGSHPFGPSHPIDRISTSTFTYDPSYEALARTFGRADYRTIPYDQMEAPVTIENDVWIGEDAIFRGGVTVGTGAVIAARSVVTRDVPPYAIVAGMPARVIRSRFPTGLVDRLLQSRWWDYCFADLPTCFDDPERFVEELRRLVGDGVIAPWTPQRIDLAESFLALSPED